MAHPARNFNLLGYTFVFLACFALAFICGSLIFIPYGSHAEKSEGTGLKIELASIIAITATPPTIELIMTPTPSGTEVSDEIAVNVSTNNLTGYKLSMNSATSNNALTHTNNTDVIPGIVNTVPGIAQSLPVNTWGYNIGSGAATFLNIPIPSAPDTLKTTSAPNANDGTIITIGAKINTSLPSGYYGNTLEFTAVANYVPPPPAVPPPDSYPDNIDPVNNPGVRDVYPTTGWEGDVVIITSDELFTNILDVKIGATSCAGWSVISTSVIACELPAKPAGSTNDIAVMNGVSTPGTDVINVATYKHMKINYFNPAQTSVTISTTDTDGTPFSATYPYFHNESPGNTFDSTACAALTPSNSTSMNIPSSIVYVRDPRNNQVYKVKRMIDNKCWMIDNLKYIGNTNRDGNIINNIDGTTGIIFRNGEGPNGAPSSPVGSGTSWNTVSGSDTGNNNNVNKAFWNNPMSHAACYSGLHSGNPTMANNTLTQCGYLYNWYAATGGTGTYGSPTNTNGAQATGSICPANFRLPSSTSGTGGPTTNGTSATVADFPVLNASMNAGSLVAGATSTFYTNWLPSGPWSGAYSGYWNYFLYGMGSGGLFRSSTASSALGSYYLMSTDPYVNTDNNDPKYLGFSVRCLLP